MARTFFFFPKSFLASLIKASLLVFLSSTLDLNWIKMDNAAMFCTHCLLSLKFLAYSLQQIQI